MTLPNDITRCTGYISTASTAFGTTYTGRADCVFCQRRLAGDPRQQSYFAGLPIFVGGKCPKRIASPWEDRHD